MCFSEFCGLTSYIQVIDSFFLFLVRKEFAMFSVLYLFIFAYGYPVVPVLFLLIYIFNRRIIAL